MSARLVGGRYQLHTMLGRGGMAAVWRGVDTRLDRPVAVKILDTASRADPTMLQRLDREARTVARLAHPNIVAVYDLAADGGVPYLVMELVEGDDLRQRLARGPMEVRQAVEIAAQVCNALEAAHEAGVVHRDIKPDNILLTPTGTVKVCDFGIARLQQATHTGVTGPATAVGTSEYMAPEQAAGGAVDARTDLYALGCVLYAMLTGAPPFSGDNPMQVMWQQVHQPAAPLASHRPGIPADLDALVDRLLAKNPADRPASAGEVRARLARMSEQPTNPVAAYPAAVAARPGRGAHARAAVVTRTQTMPVLDTGDDQGPPRGGVRIGPAGIIAVALGAAALAAIVVAGLLLLTGQAGPPAADPGTTTDTTVSDVVTSTPAPAGEPSQQLDAVRAILLAQVQAGQVDANAATDLDDRLDEITRYLAEGETGKAAKKVAEVGRKLDDFRKDGKITATAYSALLPGLQALAGSLPPADDD
jgi:eukaryotic-like serine/threonine-protein kinase